MSGAHCGLIDRHCGHAGDCSACAVMKTALANLDEYDRSAWLCHVCVLNAFTTLGRDNIKVPGYYTEGVCSCGEESRFLQVVLIKKKG